MQALTPLMHVTTCVLHRENLEYSAALRLPRGRMSGILLRMSRLALAASGGGSGESGQGSSTRGGSDRQSGLRPPTPGSSAERRAVVDAVLDMMALKGLQHDRVGSVEARGISGGQRKVSRALLKCCSKFIRP